MGGKKSWHENDKREMNQACSIKYSCNDNNHNNSSDKNKFYYASNFHVTY